MLDVADRLADLAEDDQAAAAAPASSPRPKVTLDDVKLLVEAESLDLPAAIKSYLAEPEIIPAGAAGFVRVSELRSALAAARRKRRKQARKEASTAAWRRFLGQPVQPERMKLAELVLALDDKGTEPARALLVQIAREAPLEIGLWGGVKRVWKRAEARHDFVLWAALTAAIEQSGAADVGFGTQRYAGKRAWRTLRDLGRGSPEMFPHVAVELLQHYERHGVVVGRVVHMHETHPLADTWKASPEPLLRLLENARSDVVARLAVQLLTKHHPEALRALTQGRLARLMARDVPLAGVDELFLDVLEKSADIPLAELRAAGLHDAVLKLLFSPSPRARGFAVEYARAHAADLPVERVVELVERGQGEAAKLGALLLEPVAATSLPVLVLARLLSTAAGAVAEKKLRERLAALDEAARVDALVECVFAGPAPHKLAAAFLQERMQARELWPAEVWLRVLTDVRRTWQHGSAALTALSSLNGGDPVAVLDAARLLEVVRQKPDDGAVIGGWFDKAGAARGLDVERAKGLVFPSKTRSFALRVLANRRLVKPLDLGLSWLLALAKRADPELHRFAWRTLLESTAPADFAGGSLAAGVERLFQMAAGAGENENTRSFAQTYLRCHHPVLGPADPEARELGLAPQLSRDVYSRERIWPALFDAREDVRRFAAAVARVELRRFHVEEKLAELCESDDKLVRNVALDAMLAAGEPSADPETTLALDELKAEIVFPLTESTKKSVREAGMELIRRHYARLGGAERLSWLMQSADREVRLFAVRLLWDKHRPRATPKDWRPRGGAALAFDDAGRFADAEAMRGFLRRVLFSLPPGATSSDDGAQRKHVPASVAKRRLVEVVRDVAVADAGFAAVVRPVLFEMTGSLARGEWQACLAAVARIDAAHAPDAAAAARAARRGEA